MKTVHLYLIRPSQYDDDGYVVRHWRGVLPSNTLACLAGLTEELITQKRLGESVQVKIHVLDETVDKIPIKRICRSQRNESTKTIICLTGVQTNQFPRAADLAHIFSPRRPHCDDRRLSRHRIPHFAHGNPAGYPTTARRRRHHR